MTFSRGYGVPLLLLFLLLLIPIGLSNHPLLTCLSGVVLVVIFFFSGYLVLILFSGISSSLRLVLSPVVGILCLTTTYDVFARLSLGTLFFYVALTAMSAAGITLFARRGRRDFASWGAEDCRTVLAGGCVALTVAPLFWRSGRFSGEDFVFHGPAGQDHLFHITLLRRLLQHVPPDNFMFGGLRPAVYHYFDDQTLALILRAQRLVFPGAQDLFDLYYRCYPTLIYFLIGALAYAVGRQILGTAKGGILSMLLLLGGGGLGWIIGVLQAAAHATDLVAMRERLSSSWTVWDGVDALRPLVHRPAHYHGLLICLAAISIVLRPQSNRRHWMLSGLLLGLMAGFNFTLAATFGAAALLGTVVLLLQRKKGDACNLAWLALFIFIGSLPVNAEMLLAGFRNMSPGFPFRGPNLEFSTSVWGIWISRILPPLLVPITCLLLFPILAYGVKLFGLGALVRLNLGEECYRAIATLLAIVFGISFTIGVFFPYQGIEVGAIFLQPTFWILSLFALRPIGTWLQHNTIKWHAVALWGILGVTWIQALLAFNFGYEATFSRDTMRALDDLRVAASQQDVVAYTPSDIQQRAVWGYAQNSTNFAIMAMTGLDGYFSSQLYSKFNAVPGLSGRTPEEILDKAEHLYEQRHADVESFINGDITTEASARLTNDRVCWIVVTGDEMQKIASSLKPWRMTSEIAIYRLSP